MYRKFIRTRGMGQKNGEILKRNFKLLAHIIVISFLMRKNKYCQEAVPSVQDTLKTLQGRLTDLKSKAL